MKLVFAAAVLALLIPVVGPGSEETKLGAGVTLKDPTPIAAVTAKPRDFVGRTIRVDGVATAVCTHMGCWMAVAPEGADTPGTVRLKVDDGVIVFPVSARGRKVSAQGVFEAVGADEESTEAAGEHAKHDSRAQKQYQVKASGAIVR